MKTVIVTGASKGLGNTIAQTFFSAGWKVIGTGRSPRPDTLDKGIDYRQFDASNLVDSTGFWEEIKSDIADSDVCLVNNAGGYISGKLLETAPEDYKTQMEANYFSAVYMTRGLASVIGKARIINIISNSALSAYASDSAYGASKAAEMHFFQSLQKELDQASYPITNLYPSDIASHGPNDKAISTEDLANLILELADSKTSYYLRDATLYPVK